MDVTFRDEDTAALVAMLDARQERKSRRNLQKKVYYRQDKQVHKYLKERVLELEAELCRLSRLPRSSVLPWHDTARGLRDEAFESLHHNRYLKKKVREYSCLGVLLRDFVDSSVVQSAPTGTWHASNLRLDRVRLHAHPDARRHGLDWLTQVMYHNTDKLLEKYAFPDRTPYSRLADVTVDTTSLDALSYVQRYQLELQLPLEAVLPLATSYFQSGASSEQLEVHYKTKQYLDVQMTKSIADSMTYDVVTNWSLYPQPGTTRLCRIFQDANRYVLVSQSIPDDEKLPSKNIDSKTLTWVVLDQVSPTVTIMRCLFVVSQGLDLRTGIYVPLLHEALADWNLDLRPIPPPARLDAFCQHVRTLGYRNIQSHDADFSKLFRCAI
ncbi:hypothetical protein H310_14489 [Aphanomyces invadans]|uniref:Uncharacterized protein n=1 Tax=Aphanomyces invadans TaxID=157072 RepID=A0A024T9L8_9STRA|nr:hypothetical protein H310_14489 [Aphanomyces invadans]ETV90830.1 hypothetical protein H310_14489 [Aphanomyces invadans]|eukprot:XP_008880587.1 hypothetical protein H310_14489 [Aphanomyces invadans]